MIWHPEQAAAIKTAIANGLRWGLALAAAVLFAAITIDFVLVSMAALQACVKFLKGERPRVWKPRLG